MMVWKWHTIVFSERKPVIYLKLPGYIPKSHFTVLLLYKVSICWHPKYITIYYFKTVPTRNLKDGISSKTDNTELSSVKINYRHAYRNMSSGKNRMEIRKHSCCHAGRPYPPWLSYQRICIIYRCSVWYFVFRW